MYFNIFKSNKKLTFIPYILKGSRQIFIIFLHSTVYKNNMEIVKNDLMYLKFEITTFRDTPTKVCLFLII